MSADPVEIVFQVGGIADVQEAFKTVDKVMARFERTRKASGERVVKEAKASGERAVKQAKDEAGRTADAHVKAWEKWKASVERIRRNSAAMAGRVATQQAAAEKRTADVAAADQKRIADKLA